jgi:hypothetical protein
MMHSYDWGSAVRVTQGFNRSATADQEADGIFATSSGPPIKTDTIEDLP